jgi:hypothetical protein
MATLPVWLHYESKPKKRCCQGRRMVLTILLLALETRLDGNR